jgi:hypothetical protein
MDAGCPCAFVIFFTGIHGDIPLAANGRAAYSPAIE